MFTILASEIAAAKYQHPYRLFYVEGDNGAHYDIVAVVNGQVFVESLRIGSLARIVKTGQKISTSGRVRVRIEFATDLGDTEGTLSFGDGEHIGGLAQSLLFERVEG
jgi:hypothetical protein